MKMYKLARAVGRFFFYIFVGKTRVVGQENMDLISEGPAIVCANHKSNWDPIILADVFDRQICFMAKKALFKNKILGWFLKKAGTFPVDRETNDFSAIKNAIRVLKADQILGIFPEGRRNDDGYVHEFMDGMALIAQKTNAIVVPVGITDKVGLWKRTLVQVGKPVELSELYKEKSGAELYKKINDVIHKEISILAYPNGEKSNG